MKQGKVDGSQVLALAGGESKCLERLDESNGPDEQREIIGSEADLGNREIYSSLYRLR